MFGFGKKDPLVEEVVDIVGNNLDDWGNTRAERQGLRELFQGRSRQELQGYRDNLPHADEHPGEFYCGICGWSNISTFPHSH